MDHFKYKTGRLFADAVDVARIVEEVGSPVYVYCKNTFVDHLQKMQEAYAALDTTICYSVKACGNINILRFMAEQGSGFDIVSGGELFRAFKAGADPNKIVFAGVGKADDEIHAALKAGIGYFNIESEQELQNLISLAQEQGTKTKAALRVNPDVDYQTHAYMTTGTKENKFGVDRSNAIRIFDRYRNNGHVDLCAMHVHLGTGGKKIDPYVEAVEKVLVLVDQLREKGHRIETLDLGGGYGADYESNTVPSATEYASGIVPLLQNKNLKLVLEPGKSICANAGIMVTRVLYTKECPTRQFVIVDAGMNDLIRPALYQAFHFIWPTEVTQAFTPVRRSKSLLFEGTTSVDVVGPICESGDFLAKDWAMPSVKRGDLLAVFTAGAYGITMSSNYNARPRAAEVLVDGENYTVIGRRETYEDLIAREV
jgi:diaminopimelate decarboxylase